MHSKLDLTALSVEDAAALAQIAEMAAIGFMHREDGARHYITAGATGHWLATHEAELADATRLRGLAHDLKAAAHARERQADRERCRAVRAIEALAHALRPRLAVAA